MSLQRQAIFWASALVVFIFLLWLLHEMLLPFVAGMALAYFLNPVTDRLEQLGINRLIATLIIIGLVVVAESRDWTHGTFMGATLSSET